MLERMAGKITSAYSFMFKYFKKQCVTAAVTIRLKGMLCKFQSFMAFYITELGILYVKLTQGAPACGFILDNNMSEEAFFLAIWQSSCMLFST